jgi:hypothetical protein
MCVSFLRGHGGGAGQGAAGTSEAGNMATEQGGAYMKQTLLLLLLQTAAMTNSQ